MSLGDPAGGPAPDTAPRRKRLLTLGGCNVLETGKKLAEFYDHTHIWNVSWPSLGTPPVRLVRQPDDRVFDKLRGFIMRECSKAHLPAISDGGWDVILMASQFTQYTFVESGESCIPDFTDAVFIRDEELAGAPRPDIRDYLGAGARTFTWRDDAFYRRMTEGFDHAFANLLAPSVAAGTKLILYDHVITDQELTPDGIVPLDVTDISERIALNEKIVNAARRPGVHVISTRPSFAPTSADAPWGIWEYHPIEEQYFHLALEIARIAGDQLQWKLTDRHMMSQRRKSLGLLRDLEISNDRLRKADDEIAALSASVAGLKRELGDVRRTLSWRITSPLRAVRKLTRREG